MKRLTLTLREQQPEAAKLGARTPQANPVQLGSSLLTNCPTR
jgi:hypothetical protein